MGRRTYALYKGTIYQWIDILKKFRIKHQDGASAHIEWDIACSKNKKLPFVKIVVKDDNGEFIENNSDISKRKIVSKSEEKLLWNLYFPDTSKALCPCCNNEQISSSWFIIGHNIPHSKGGNEELENLVPICKVCNDGMGDRYTIVEYKQKLEKVKKLKDKLNLNVQA